MPGALTLLSGLQVGAELVYRSSVLPHWNAICCSNRSSGPAPLTRYCQLLGSYLQLNSCKISRRWASSPVGPAESWSCPTRPQQSRSGHDEHQLAQDKREGEIVELLHRADVFGELTTAQYTALAVRRCLDF